MRIDKLHSWDLSPKEAIEVQKKLQGRIRLADDFGEIRYVAGVDVGFLKAENRGRAAVVVLQLSDLGVVDSAVSEEEMWFPYVPGLLSFREIPLILSALAKLRIPPDIFLCDGQGIAHPRRVGLASHLGLITDIPAIGVAKTKLCGSYTEPPAEKGQWSRLEDKDELIGAVLRTRKNVKPMFVSPGHKISLHSTINFVMQCVTRYRLPETTRKAHSLSLFAKSTPT